MNRSRLWGGVALIALGMLFLLDSMDVMPFGEVIRTYWPLVLIALGLRIVATGSGGSGRLTAAPDAPAPPGEAEVTAAETLHHSSVFGDLTLRVESRGFGGGSASAVFGDIEIDMRTAQLREGHSLLKLSGVFGSIRVRLPQGIDYAVSMNTVLGDLEAGERRSEGFSPVLRYQTPGYGNVSRTLMITASQVLGDVSVRS